jgi:hypothetical protein
VEFVVVTAAAFLPWALVTPWAVFRALRRPWPDATARLWGLLALWAVVVIGFFAISPFKLPHYGLPAFPALALLVARVWDESIDAAPNSLRPRTLLVPVLVIFMAAAASAAVAWAGVVPLPAETLSSLDVATRNQAARGQAPAALALERYGSMLASCTLVFALGTVGTAVAMWRRAPGLGVAVALATMVAFLPVAADGMTMFARSRSAATVVDALALRCGRQRRGRARGAARETPRRSSCAVPGPVRVVDGLQSNLAFGATFAGFPRPLLGIRPGFRPAWSGRGRVFLVSGVDPAGASYAACPAGAST